MTLEVSHCALIDPSDLSDVNVAVNYYHVPTFFIDAQGSIRALDCPN